MTEREKAQKPEDITRLFVERANAKDAEGLALLYEEDAVMAFPPGQQTVGRRGDPGALGEGAAGHAGIRAGNTAAHADQR